MKLNLIVLLSFFLITYTGCDKKGIEYQILNNSNTAITNVSISTSEEVDKYEIQKIEPKSEASGFLSMDKNQYDGSYVLKFKRYGKNSEVLKRGYYTNGHPLDRKVIFDIKSDTVLTEFESHRY